MNKTKSLFIVSISALVALTGSVIAMSRSLHSHDSLAVNRNTIPDEYTLTLDSSNKLANDNSVLTSSGNKVYFATEGNFNKSPSNGWFEFGENDLSNALYNTTAISGMKSISFRMNTSETYLYFGYKEDGVIHYSNYYNMTGVDQQDGEYLYEYSFNESNPGYFKLTPWVSNCLISEMSIVYSCSETEIVPTELSSFEFTYLSEQDAYRIDGFASKRNKVQTLFVPGTYNGKPVVEIKNNAFFTNSAIEYVIISEGITKIGDYAFYFDTSLKSIVLPSTLIKTGDHVYDGCLSLTSGTVTSAMSPVNPLTFAGNQFLTEIVVDGNDDYYAYDGMLFAKNYNTYQNALLVCPAGKEGTITIPDNCQYIDTYAFKNSKATSIVIGSGVQLIAESFTSCNKLTNFSVSSSNNSYSAQEGLLCDKLGGHLLAYPRGISLDFLTIPSSVRYVGDHIFDKVSNLKDLYLNNVTNIGVEAFANMPNLESVASAYVTDIGTGAFKNDKKLSSVTLNNSLNELPNEIFMGCTSLATISLPSSLTRIGYRAFKNCSSLNSIDLDTVIHPQYLARIEGEAFMNCTSLDISSVPESVTYIGTYVFRNTNIDSFFIPTSFTSIPDGMFMDCDNLTSVTIPTYIKTIGYDAFNDCENITSITIPDNSVVTIHSKAFLRTNFNKIFVPKSVQVIEGSALASRQGFHIYTDISVDSSMEVYSSGTDEGGYLRDGWTRSLGVGFLIYYNQTRAYFNTL